MRRRAKPDAPPPPGTAHITALRLLGLRDYTSAEIAARLRDRGHDADEVATAIERLTADGTLDDRRTANAHVRHATRIKRRGAIRIKQELAARGLPDSIVTAALSAISPEDDAQTIETFLDRKRTPARLTPAERRRIFAQLLRKGFSSDAIAAALRRRSHRQTD